MKTFICENCGAVVSSEENIQRVFCPECGKKIYDAPEMKNEIEVVESTCADDNIAEESKSITRNSKGKNRKILLGILGLSVLVVVIGIVCVLWQLKNNSSEDINDLSSDELMFGEFEQSDVPTDAVEFNGHWYCVYPVDAGMDWDSLQNFCFDRNGYLATISSKEENDFIYNTLLSNYSYDNIYIGLEKNETSGLWTWVNGEVLSYENLNAQSLNGSYAMFSAESINGSWVTSECIPSTDSGTIVVQSVEASSVLVEPQITHSAERVFDNNTSTAWVEGSAGHGIGDSLTINFDGNYLLDELVINSGYQKTSELYNKNSRPNKIAITFDDGVTEEYALDDVEGAQHIKFKKARVTSSIVLKITTVYEGNVYEDTAISEISFKGYPQNTYFICEWGEYIK